MPTQTVEIKGNKFQVVKDYKGYPMIEADGRLYRVHRLMWEQTYGKLPPDYDLHHKDFDRQNWALENLQPMTHSEHSRLHASLRRQAREGKNDDTKRVHPNR